MLWSPTQSGPSDHPSHNFKRGVSLFISCQEANTLGVIWVKKCHSVALMQ